MLHRHIHHNQFVIFSLYSFLLTFFLGILVAEQIQMPIAMADEYHIPRKHISLPDTKILIFGDMMLDRHVREKININGTKYPFELIRDTISDNDIVVANAEGPFTFFDSITVNKENAPLNFTFDPIILTTLKEFGFTLLGQANNHTLNFGMEGFNQSTTSITIAGLNYFGDPQNKNITPYIKEINGEKIGFVAYNEFSYQGKDNVISKIQEIKKEVSYLIVYPHWGEEYNPSFTLSQQKIAHEFIDAGADVIIGMHPHVIEPIEFYKNKLIFYSIGNFIFDQAKDGPKTEGLAIKILLNKESASYEIKPFFIKNAQVSLMDSAEKQIVLNFLEKTLVNPNEFRVDLTNGIIKLVR